MGAVGTETAEPEAAAQQRIGANKHGCHARAEHQGGFDGR